MRRGADHRLPIHDDHRLLVGDRADRDVDLNRSRWWKGMNPAGAAIAAGSAPAARHGHDRVRWYAVGISGWGTVSVRLATAGA